jgi:WhiB family redox-sensing transcriptional regulator
MQDTKHERGPGHPSDDDWQRGAACRGLDPQVFYPINEEEAEAARAVCASCDVAVACLEWALARREKDGVWGGATERDRRRIIRQRRRAARLAQTA